MISSERVVDFLTYVAIGGGLVGAGVALIAQGWLDEATSKWFGFVFYTFVLAAFLVESNWTRWRRPSGCYRLHFVSVIVWATVVGGLVLGHVDSLRPYTVMALFPIEYAVLDWAIEWLTRQRG